MTFIYTFAMTAAAILVNTPIFATDPINLSSCRRAARLTLTLWAWITAAALAAGQLGCTP